jgi:hypothetical protein
MEIISATQARGCPRKCSGASSEIFIAEYELHPGQNRTILVAQESSNRL